MLKEQGNFKNKPISYDIRKKRESAAPATGLQQNSLVKIAGVSDTKAKVKNILRLSDQAL